LENIEDKTFKVKQQELVLV